MTPGLRNIYTLLKLEVKNRFSRETSLKNGKTWANILFALLGVALAELIIYWVADLFFEMFGSAGMVQEGLILLVSALFLLLVISGISSTIKVLYYKGDNEILMRFPVTGADVFISKTLFLLTTQLLITAVVTVPVGIAYAHATGSYDGLAPRILLCILFLSLVPFLISNILAIPIMHLTNRIRHRYGLIIVLLTVLVTALFAGYMILFSQMVQYLRDSSFSVFSEEVVVTIQRIAPYFLPMRFFADILMGQRLHVAYPFLILITAVLLSATIAVIVLLYQKTLLKNVEIEGSAFRHVTKNRKRSIFGTLLKKEFIQVFRSVNYSFQYFVLACSMPTMVYFCNDIAMQIGRNDIGDKIAVGMTLLVMIIFATVITSFSATSITREGENFYHTKVMPVSFHLQLFVKFFMYLIVSVLANAVCTLILILTKQMDWKIALWIFGIVQMLSIGLTLISMRLDIRKPRFNLVGEGEMVSNNANTTTSVIIGFAVSVFVGMLGMLTGYLLTDKYMILVVSAVSIVIFVAALLFYFIRLKSAYSKIVKG